MKQKNKAIEFKSYVRICRKISTFTQETRQKKLLEYRGQQTKKTAEIKVTTTALVEL